jgi:hypothetical protein
LRLGLDAIVAYRGLRVERVGDVRLGEVDDVAGLDRMLRPDAGVLPRPPPPESTLRSS